MKRKMLVLLVTLLAVCAQAQQLKLSDGHFEIIIPSTGSVGIVTDSAEGGDYGNPGDYKNKLTEYFTGSKNEHVFISVRTLEKDVPLTQEVADFYLGKAATQDSLKDSEGWVYNITARTRGHFNGSALTFAKGGKMGNQGV